MIYSKEFKEKIKKVYPDWESIQKFMDNDSDLVCQQLFDKCSSGMSFDTVLNASSLEELQRIAKQEKEKWALYRECVQILRSRTHSLN